MSLHRISLLTMAALFSLGMTSIASACCGVAYAPVGFVPVVPAPIYVGGCGGCGSTAAIVYAQPVAPTPLPARPYSWGAGCGCGQSLYVVNQGPDYTGPGIMIPYRTWSPAAAYGPAYAYPYVGGYGYRYGYRYGYHYGWHHAYHAPGSHVVYHRHRYTRPLSPEPRLWRTYPQHTDGTHT